MLPVGRAPQHVTRIELEDRAAEDLGPANALSDDQRLAERVLVPGGARPRLENVQWLR